MKPLVKDNMDLDNVQDMCPKLHCDLIEHQERLSSKWIQNKQECYTVIGMFVHKMKVTPQHKLNKEDAIHT